MLALLRERRVESEVVCPGGGALEGELQHLGIKVHPLEFGKYSLRQNPLWHVGFYRRIRGILKSSQPDALVINLDGNTPLVTLAAVRAKIPVIRFSRFEFEPPSRLLDRWCWLQAMAIICPSELVKSQVLAWAPRQLHSRVHRLYDSYAGRAAMPHEVAALRREFGLGEDKVIGCIGRLHRRKRIEIAIEAIAKVRQQDGSARLLIIGGDGSPDEAAYKRELQHLAVHLGVGEAVTFTGVRPAEMMPAIIAALDVCVLPSESESFGMVLMEAWAQGVPTVASDVGGCGEITRASDGGLLAPVGDSAAFAGQLLELLTAPRDATTMGQNGREWVVQNCNPANYAADFTKLINTSNYRSQNNDQDI
jgi:glycosyltransferase involved in cell wall biosynthesis